MRERFKTVFSYGIPIFLLIILGLHFTDLINLGFTIIDALSSLFIGFAIAYVLNLIMSKLETIYFPKSTQKIIIASRRPVCVILSIVLILLIFALILGLILPKLGQTVSVLAAAIPEALTDLGNFLTKLMEKYPVLENYLSDFLNTLNITNIAKQIATTLGSFSKDFLSQTTGILSSLFGAITNFVIAFIFALYMLFGKENLLRQINRICSVHMSKRAYTMSAHLCHVIHDSFSKYIIGQCTEAVILGCLCTFGMMLFRFPYAPMIGAVVGVTALLPVVGAYIGAGVGLFLIVMENPIQGIFFLIFILVLQQLENNLIYPRVVGSSIGLPGIWVLAAVTLSGSLFGVLGILLGVPTASVLYNLLREYTAYVEQKKQAACLSAAQPVQTSPEASKEE